MDPFRLTVTGDIEKTDVSVGYGRLNMSSTEAEDILNEEFPGAGGDVSFSDAEVSDGVVTISAHVTIENVEVAIEDFNDFDAELAIQEATSYDVRVSNQDFEVEDGPSGFDIVEETLGDREQAIAVYVALQRAGFDVI